MDLLVLKHKTLGITDLFSILHTMYVSGTHSEQSRMDAAKLSVSTTGPACSTYLSSCPFSTAEAQASCLAM
jgi:hypothetical protein